MLLDELQQLVDKSKSPSCAVGTWVKEQEPEFQEILEVFKNNPNISLTQALTIIKKYHPNLPFKRTLFGYHMRGTCSCQTA